MKRNEPTAAPRPQNTAPGLEQPSPCGQPAWRKHAGRGKHTPPLLVLFSFLFLVPSPLTAGLYTDSGHGSTAYGVNRPDLASRNYSRGNCAHCHEQHSSVESAEPAPNTGDAAGPDLFLLFDRNAANQSTNFCFNCHGSGTSSQSGGNVVNRSYSFRAGGWTADPVDDVAESFANTTAHGLDDIATFIDGRWGYGSDSNPCTACHNPHAAQGDPANAPLAAKSAASRGWPLSRPSRHADLATWGRQGDDPGEKMSDYAPFPRYQAPYRFYVPPAVPATYEPDGSLTTDGSNLADTVSLCTDCHNNSNIIVSTRLGRPLKTIDWAIEKHGRGAATNDSYADHLPPYQDARTGQYVLACTDCHEGHGSANDFLLRQVVNGLPVTIPGGNGGWDSLCSKCHDVTANPHHSATMVAHGYTGFCMSAVCHITTFPTTTNNNCAYCHYHGSTQIPVVPATVFNPAANPPTAGPLQLYNGGELLF